MTITFPAIEVSVLTKNYGRTAALTGLNLRVKTGQVAGFLGTTDSGKSTNSRILLGRLKVSGGEARMLGPDKSWIADVVTAILASPADL